MVTVKTTNSKPARQQRGVALLLMMLVLIVAATAALVTRLGSTDLRTSRLVASQDVLASTREALLQFAVIQPDRVPGSPVLLPCPDLDDSGGFLEGEAHSGACGSRYETVIGRVPWRTLGIKPPLDAAGACLWYVVSGSHKEAGAATAELINPDSNGQLQLWGVEGGAVIEGADPARRPLAFLIAPMEATAGQTRPAAGNRNCSANFNASDYLDTDSGSGISNAALSGVADSIDTLAVVAGRSETHNDRIATISRADLASATRQRADYNSTVRALGLALAGCYADYARHNSGGSTDNRMPWPAALQLVDYRVDSAYDDSNSGEYSGRLADIVDDSNVLTTNPAAEVLSNCDGAVVTSWTAEMQQMWRHWKDHFFYLVAPAFSPSGATPSACTDCISVNGSGQYAAVLVFANARLDSLAQRRDAPPIDADTRDDIGNYLEGNNAAAFPHTGGTVDLESQAANASFNDLLFCIDASLAVSEC